MRNSDTIEIERPQRMTGVEKLQRGARSWGEGPQWAGHIERGSAMAYRAAARRGQRRS